MATGEWRREGDVSRRFWTARVLPAAAVALVLSSTVSTRSLQYPTTQKVEHVDTYHGTTVSDPYRWLEDDNSAETARWVEAQNRVTFGYLEQIPYRAQLKNRLEALYNYPKYLGALPQG